MDVRIVFRERLCDRNQGDGVDGVVRHYHQRLGGGQGQRQLDDHLAPLAFGALQRDLPVQALDIRPHDVHSNAAPRDIRERFGRRETGKEDVLEDLFLGRVLGDLPREQTLFDHLLAQRLRIDPLAIVFDGQVDVGFLVPGGHRNGAGFGLSRRAPLLGRLDSMVYGVAQDVYQRVGDLLDH